MTDKELATTPMEMIAAAVEKGMAPEVISGFMDLQERWQANNAKVAFERALVRFQTICPVIPKTKVIKTKTGTVRSKYAPYDVIMRAIQPSLNETKLSVRVAQTEIKDGSITVRVRVAHEDGHSEDTEFSCPVDPEMHANDSQKVASANSYAKRYGVCNALNIVTSDEDDDIERGGGFQAVPEKDVIAIRDRIESLGRDEEKFCLAIKVSSLEMMTAQKLGHAKDLLNRVEHAGR